MEQCLPGPAPSLSGEDGPPGQTQQLDSRAAGQGTQGPAPHFCSCWPDPTAGSLPVCPLWRPHNPGRCIVVPVTWGRAPCWVQPNPGCRGTTSGPWNTKHAGPGPPFAHKTESLPALEDVLGMELTGDKGCPSGLLTPSRCSIPGGGVPTAVC